MLHITVLADAVNNQDVAKLLARKCVVNQVPFRAFIALLKGKNNLEADIVICWPDLHNAFGSGLFDHATAWKILHELRALPHTTCMADGRKWRSVPFRMLFDGMLPQTGFQREQRQAELSITYLDFDSAFGQLVDTVRAYRSALTSGFEDLGFLVKLDNGRLRVGPAFDGSRLLENEFYSSAFDITRNGSAKYVTIDRDNRGIQYEIEQLEFLLNKPALKENELQKFFQDNPHFLSRARGGTPLPHTRFAINEQNLLIPDFIMRPDIISRDSSWEVLDLKLPSVKLLSGAGRRVQFSHHVIKAITQLKDYGEYFRNPANQDKVRSALQHNLRYPKLAVLIGRLPKSDDAGSLELAQSREPQVSVVTYDDVLESQRSLLT